MYKRLVLFFHCNANPAALCAFFQLYSLALFFSIVFHSSTREQQQRTQNIYMQAIYNTFFIGIYDYNILIRLYIQSRFVFFCCCCMQAWSCYAPSLLFRSHVQFLPFPVETDKKRLSGRILMRLLSLSLPPTKIRINLYRFIADDKELQMFCVFLLVFVPYYTLVFGITEENFALHENYERKMSS